MNKEAKLISDLLKFEEKPTRKGYGEGVVLAAKKNENVVVLCADLTESTRNEEFKKQFPDRFIQMGVHEQLLAALAAGMALEGKIPYITSYAMFCPGRAWEMIRTNICLNGVNVKIIGSHAGVSVGPDGATHQAIEDIAIMRPIPNMTIIAPCDAIEARKATVALLDVNGPCYARFAREKSPVFTTEETPFEIGKAEVFRDGNDVAIVACGPLLYNALIAAEELAKDGFDVRVINSHTIKPLDEKTILAAAQECGAIVTVEEHQITGGLGGAVTEYLSQAHPTNVLRIGVQNKFGQSGAPKELIEHYGMGVSAIKEAIKKVIQRKNI
ncbi:MAG: transketolase C-terminal domain-containing protein [bacterium]|nr:transketolase C-terminal domain-containing protein [bacterium]